MFTGVDPLSRTDPNYHGSAKSFRKDVSIEPFHRSEDQRNNSLIWLVDIEGNPT